MRLAVTAALLLSSPAAWSAIDGDPDPPYPHRPYERCWLDSTNDGVISLRHHDDGLSAQARAGYGGDRVCGVVDWDLDTDIGHRSRDDQLVVAAGGRVLPVLRVLGGVRVTGDLGGQAVQNVVHEAIGDRRVVEPYHGRTLVEPLSLAVIQTPTEPVCGRVVASVAPSCRQVDAELVAGVGAHLRIEVGFVASSVSPGAIAGDSAARLADIQRRGPHAGFVVQLAHLGWGIEYGGHECIGRIGIVF